ncbi:MAG: hypothetical protein IPK17_17205 [Chloroflexi bacterium]|uniref:hypothetical protein n=1 Tax=Candidatus Flexifilum breve TaxID=3140694 RepID=UPI0031354D21|nr:hypothetical protein [Chloroflexota bacterium]
MRRLILPIVLALITVLLLLRTTQPALALGFGVVTYGGIAIIQQALAAIRTRDIILPWRYGRDFSATGSVAVAQGWLRVVIGVVLVGAGVWFGVQALAV